MERDREGGERTGEAREEEPVDSGGERETGLTDVPAPSLGWGVVGELGLENLAVAGDEDEDEEDKAKLGELRPSGSDGSMS